jgi:purine-binding chemotaxis protein CheW
MNWYGIRIFAFKAEGRQCMAEEFEATQYLTFVLNEEVFAVDVGRVREILEMTSITKVPQVPEFMRGVINLRGCVVPVIDLRLKFGMQGAAQTVNTCIIVVEVAMDGENIVLGALADSVQEVIEMEASQIEAAPHIGSHLKTEFIRGMGKHDGRFVMILDIDKIFSAQELDAVVGTTAA